MSVVARPPLDAHDRGLAVDLRPALARAPGQRLRQIGRLDVAVLQVADRPDHALDVAEWPDLPDLVRRQELHPDADRLGDAGVLVVLVHPVAVQREPDVAHLPEPDVLPGLGLQRPVERHRVLVDLANGVAHVEQRQEPRRVPG